MQVKVDKTILKFNTDRELDQQRLIKNIDKLECTVAELQRDKDNLQNDLKPANDKIKELQNRLNNMSSNDLSNENKRSIKSCQDDIVLLHKSFEKLDTKIDGSLLHPELVAEVKAEILMMREEIDTHRKETSKNIATILEEVRMSRQNAGDYIDGRLERLAINDISPITKQIANLGKDISEIKAGHNKITEILEDMKRRPEMSMQYHMIQMPAAKQSTHSNSDRKESPQVKEKEEIATSASLNNPPQHISTEVNQQASNRYESCDVLIIGDSILQRIDESQFHRKKKTHHNRAFGLLFAVAAPHSSFHHGRHSGFKKLDNDGTALLSIDCMAV